MKKYALLSNNRVMVVYSDNIDDRTMNLYPLKLDTTGTFDPEVHIAEEYSYGEIIEVDSDYVYLYSIA